MLLDQSGSLRHTDPGGARVDAADLLLQEIELAREQAGAKLDVAASGFDTGYQRTSPWSPLNASSLPTLQSDVAAYRKRTGGLDTDYAAALAGVRDELRDRQRAFSGERCQAVVLLTDGQFDLEARPGLTKDYAPGARLDSRDAVQRAIAGGTEEVCRPGGTADQIRATGALTFAVGLGASSDFSLLRSIATGSAPSGTTCGVPPTAPVGGFYLANGVDDLVFAVNAAIGSAVIDTSSPVCVLGQPQCPEGTRSFVLDDSVRVVDIVGGAGQPGLQVRLVPPGGSPSATSMDIVYGSGGLIDTSLGGSKVKGAWLNGNQLHLDLTRVGSGQGWAGQWKLVFFAPRPGTVRSQIRVTGDLAPRLLGPATLSADKGATVRVGLLSESDRQPVDVSTVQGEAVVSASLVGADGSSNPVTEGAPLRIAAHGLPVDLSTFPPGHATLRLVLTLTTRSTRVADVDVPGTHLTDKQVDVPVDVQLPAGYPSTADRVDLGHLEGPGTLAGALAVTGPGCVWVRSSQISTGPRSVQGTMTSPHSDLGSCQRLAKGQHANLPLSLALRGEGNGTVSGRLVLALAPDGAGAARDKPVVFVADLQKRPNKTLALLVFVAALVLGLGLPLAFLYLVKHLTAKIPGEPMRLGVVPVEVTDHEVTRHGLPLQLTDEDTRLQPVSPGGSRRLDLPEATLRTRAGASLTSPPYTEVLAPGRRVLTSAGSARLPLGVHGTWTALVDEAVPDRVRLIVLLPVQADRESYERLAGDVRRRLPSMLQRADGARPKDQAARPAATSSPPGRLQGPGVPAPPPPPPLPPAPPSR